MKYPIHIQSISDIITNSSSETFCRIRSKEQIEEIYEALKSVLPGDDTDYEPVVYLDELDEEDYDWLPKDFLEGLRPGERCARLKLPYSIWCPTFFKAGIESILKEKFPNGSYTILYEENR